jgi:hypothetical protein
MSELTIDDFLNPAVFWGLLLAAEAGVQEAKPLLTLLVEVSEAVQGYLEDDLVSDRLSGALDQHRPLAADGMSTADVIDADTGPSSFEQTLAPGVSADNESSFEDTLAEGVRAADGWEADHAALD